MDIEVEIRSFISEDKYIELLAFFKENGVLINEDYQETYYFDCDEDLRIQKNNFYSKIWLKKGKIHDDQREEIEIKFDKDYFGKLEELFLTLGLNIDVKWFRKRFTFTWEGINVMIDHTKGYGYIIELEKMSNKQEKEIVLDLLKEKLEILKVPLTSKEEFNRKYKYYKTNWRELTK